MPSPLPPPRPSLRCHLPLSGIVGCSCVDVDLINLYVPPRGLIRLPGPSTPHFHYSPALEKRLVLSAQGLYGREHSLMLSWLKLRRTEKI
ncbi:unnamed protein product [Miscanthus lutarioriparius]|uniref:Uncharacterized protein n=1 Tax=Miscanthus lutarioriparius TaxID=422564 RepID=A0A811N0B1_9POAL|nr:unnamed protein product [Miscanthus lutarioriparius]